VREDLRAAYVATAERYGPGDLLRMLAMVAELDVESRFRKSGNPRTMLESLLLRFAWLDRTVSIEELLQAASGSPPSPESSSSLAGPGGAATRSPLPPSEPRHEASTRQTTPSNSTEPAAPRRAEARPAAQPRRPAQPAGQAEAQKHPGPAADAESALRRVIQNRRGIPNGILIFLAAASAHIEGDRFILELPDGPGLERLNAEPQTRAVLEAALVDELGRSIILEVRRPPADASGGRGPERLTPERVRTEQLSRLVRSDPMLGKAVESWDLELLD
jgi:hypothetical protein